MRKTRLILLIAIIVAPALTVCGRINVGNPLLIVAASIQGRNSIQGTVFNDEHRPVADIYVELLDDFNSSIGQSKTDVNGRFRFSNLADGRYILRVKPYGSDYLEQIREVVLASISSVRAGDTGSRTSGGVSEHVDIALRRDERGMKGPFGSAPDVVFAQNVPGEAKKLYEEGLSFLRDKKETEGFNSLKRALEIFPDYYLALDRLGAEYAVRGDKNRSYYEAGLVLLTKATEVNPKGFSNTFGLGWTQYQLGMNAEAIETLRKAVAIYAKSGEAHLWLGKALRKAKTLDQAEAEFKRANQLEQGKIAEVHWQLAGLYSDQKRYQEAADEMELYLKQAPKGEDVEKIRNIIKQLRDKANTSQP